MQGLYNYHLCGRGGGVHAKRSCTCIGDMYVDMDVRLQSKGGRSGIWGPTHWDLKK